MSNSDTIPFPDRSSNSSQVSLTPEEHQRLELLKQQKNIERQEKERSVWREASKPIRTFGIDEWDSENPANSSPNEKPRKTAPRFLSRFRLGRLLR